MDQKIESKKIQKIAVLTSGGDGPGMNAAIRAVTRTALSENLEVFGVKRGYSGLLEGDMIKLDASSVGNILQRGGTVLQTSRCPEFHQQDARKEAYNLLKRKNIDALVVIGGEGSFNGAHLFSSENNFPVIGIPGTIDNDISGTDYTIGFDTAVHTAVEAVDRIRDTASSHDRIFIIEVMGRNSSSIATYVSVCSGAENVILPHEQTPYKEIVHDIKRGIARGKTSSLLIVAEGDRPGFCYDVQKNLKEKYQLPSHVCILGHIQRGGTPTPKDRFIASKMGYLSVKALIDKKVNKVTVYRKGKIELAPLEECLAKNNRSYSDSLEMIKVLSI